MRARIRIAEYDVEFDGAARLWNEMLRPIFGGPEARDAPPVSPQSSSMVTSRRRDASPSPPEPAAAAAPHRDAPISVEDAFAELAERGGRRAEKDAVLLAVWQVGAGERGVHFDEVASVVHAHDAFRDVRVKPHLLKHVNRSRMLELAEAPQTVLMTDKGRRYARSLFE